MTNTIEYIWALFWLAVVVALAVPRKRLGVSRAASWLVVIGLFLIIGEEPTLTLWLSNTSPSGDRDGMATLITPMARAHVIDAGVVSLAAAVALTYIAWTGLRRRHRWAWLVLVWGFAVTFAAEITTTLLVHSRGLPLPGPGGDAGRAGLGWQPLAVGLLAWALGLAFGRVPAAPAAPAVPASAQIVEESAHA